MAEDTEQHPIRTALLVTTAMVIGGAVLYTCGFRRLRQYHLENTLQVFDDPADTDHHIPYQGEVPDPEYLVATFKITAADREDGVDGEIFHTKITIRFGGQTVTIVVPEIITYRHYQDTIAVASRLVITRLEQRTARPLSAYHRRSVYQHLQVLLDDNRP